MKSHVYRPSYAGANLNSSIICINKIIYILCFDLIIVALLLLFKSPTAGYEVSIYYATPLAVWLALSASLILSLFSILYIESKSFYTNRLWIIGYFIILFNISIILSIHILRNYTFWGGSADPATHLGIIKDILSSGFIESDNIYPISHIYASVICLLCRIEAIRTISWIPTFFYMLYVIYTYLTAKALSLSPSKKVFIGLASMIPLTGWYLNFTPNHLANFLIPMAFFFIVKCSFLSNPSWKIVTIIISFLYPLFHIVPSFAICILVFSLLMQKNVRLIFWSYKPCLDTKISIVLLAFMIIWAITWISSFYYFEAFVRNIHSIVVEGGGMTNIDKLAIKIDEGQSFGYDPLIQFIKIYGGQSIYLIIALLSVIWLRASCRIDISMYYVSLIIFLAITALLFLLKTPFSPIRLLLYPTFIATLFVGISFGELLQRNSMMYRHALFLLILIILFGAILAVYPSPYILTLNLQTTEAQIDGMEWFLNERAPDIQLTGIFFTPRRFSDFLLSKEDKSKQGYIPYYLFGEHSLPFRFSANYSSLGILYPNSSYILLTKRDMLTFTEAFPELANNTYSIDDFNKLDSDIDTAKLYDNLDFSLRYIKPTSIGEKAK